MRLTHLTRERRALRTTVLRPAAVDALHDKLKAAENRRDGDPEPPAVWTYAGQAGNAFIDGREDNMAKFKPGVYDMKFVFSSNNAQHTVRTPYWYEWESVLRPVIESVLGKGACERLIRLQLAYMTPGAQIFHHRDTGRWVKDAHRVHIPLDVNPHTRFQVKLHADDDEWVQVPLERGRSFEINNNFMHRVFNDGEEYRTHLLVDLGEERRTYIDLKPGGASWRCLLAHAFRPRTPLPPHPPEYMLLRHARSADALGRAVGASPH